MRFLFIILVLGGCAPLNYVGSVVSGAAAINREDQIKALKEQILYLTPETTAAGD